MSQHPGCDASVSRIRPQPITTCCGQNLNLWRGRATPWHEGRDETGRRRRKTARRGILRTPTQSASPNCCAQQFATEENEFVPSPIQTPQANGPCRARIGSVQCECLDRLLIYNERHIAKVLANMLGTGRIEVCHDRLLRRLAVVPRAPNR